jgi:hypothetical protein
MPKPRYTPEHAAAGLDVKFPEIETWPNQFPLLFRQSHALLESGKSGIAAQALEERIDLQKSDIVAFALCVSFVEPCEGFVLVAGKRVDGSDFARGYRLAPGPA